MFSCAKVGIRSYKKTHIQEKIIENGKRFQQNLLTPNFDGCISRFRIASMHLSPSTFQRLHELPDGCMKDTENTAKIPRNLLESQKHVSILKSKTYKANLWHMRHDMWHMKSVYTFLRILVFARNLAGFFWNPPNLDPYHKSILASQQ